MDSGADLTIFDAELAEELGLNLTAGERATVMGATGQPQEIYLHQVQLSVGPHSYGARVAFMPNGSDYGLGGQLGLFDQFVVTFDRRALEMKLAPYRE